MITKVLHFSAQIIRTKNVVFETDDPDIDPDWSQQISAPLAIPYLSVKFRAEVDDDLEKGATYADSSKNVFYAIDNHVIELIKHDSEFTMRGGILVKISSALV